MRCYEYRHRVGLEDTNLVGNVYFVNHVRWQGRCREMFLREHAPDVVSELARGLTLATTRVSCAYYRELAAFDEVLVRMSAGSVQPSRITMLFDYLRILPDGNEELVARGEQEVVCMRREGSRTMAVPLPESLCEALAPFVGTPIR